MNLTLFEAQKAHLVKMPQEYKETNLEIVLVQIFVLQNKMNKTAKKRHFYELFLKLFCAV